MIDRATRYLALAGGAALIGLMLLTVADVGLRYLFNAPIFGGQDLAEIGLLVVVACSLAYCGHTGGHVAVDLFGQVMPAGIRRWSDLAVRILSVAMLSVIVWRCWSSGLDAAEYGEASNLLNIPYGPFYWALAVGFAAYAAVLAAEIVGSLRAAASE